MSNKKDINHLMHLSKNLKLLEDGLNTVRYKVLRKEKKPLYTRILVKLPKPSELPKGVRELYLTDSGKFLFHKIIEGTY